MFYAILFYPFSAVQSDELVAHDALHQLECGDNAVWIAAEDRAAASVCRFAILIIVIPFTVICKTK